MAVSAAIALASVAPCAAQEPDTVVLRSLPTGLSYSEVRRTLASLEPVEPPPTEAAETPASVVTARIDGLLVDETVTKMGQDFYSVFYSAWQAPPGAANYTLRVQEQPSRGLGTRVVVFLDDEMLFQLQLQPRYEVIEELAQQAAAYTRMEVARRRPAEMPTAAGDPGGGS